MAECGICLEDIKSPVCIPCGHVYCEKCIRTHIESSEHALESSCPSCRDTFYIAMPDLSFVPKKYHDFMLPSTRKIYLDIPSTSLLVDEIEQLKKRVAALSRDRDALMDKCEGFMAASRQYADKERSARMEALAAQDFSNEIQKKYEALKKAYEAKIDCSLCHTSSDDRKRKSSCFSDMVQAPLLTQSGKKSTYAPQFNPRVKRALPRSSFASTSQMEESHDPPPRFVKRQRYSDVGPGIETDWSSED